MTCLAQAAGTAAREGGANLQVGHARHAGLEDDVAGALRLVVVVVVVVVAAAAAAVAAAAAPVVVVRAA